MNAGQPASLFMNAWMEENDRIAGYELFLLKDTPTVIE
jgi:hypothetical protein